MLVLLDGSLHAYNVLVSFGSDDLNESLPQRANSQFGSSSFGWRTRVEIDES